MKVELYTAKTLKESVAALNERLTDDKQKQSAKALSGFVEKGGKFSLSLSSRVLGFRRTTEMAGLLEREHGMTVLRGRVYEGLDPRRVRVVIYAVLCIALLTFLNGNGLLAIGFSAAALMAYVWMVGDHNNSTLLVKEVRRLLNAKDKPMSEITNKTSASAAGKPIAKASSASASKPNATGAKASTPTANKPSTKAASAGKPTSKSASAGKPKPPVR